MIPSSSIGIFGFRSRGGTGFECRTAFERNQRVGPGEGLLTGGHLVQDYAKREQVAAAVYDFAAGLFRGHVDGRAWNHSEGSQRVIGAGVVFRSDVVD